MKTTTTTTTRPACSGNCAACTACSNSSPATVKTLKPSKKALKEAERAEKRAATVKQALDYLQGLIDGINPAPYALHLTPNHGGKMQGFQSLSTACIVNPRCIAYSKNPLFICNKCYAITTMEARGENFQGCFIDNFYLLNYFILPAEMLPFINARVFRLEAFGDIASENHFINYINLCNKNSHTQFSIWTKNPDIIEKVFAAGYKKPENLIIIISSPEMNKQLNINNYPYADKVFTVYTYDYAAENDITINCAVTPFKPAEIKKSEIKELNEARSCINCMKCYSHNNTIYINELLK